MSVRLLLGVLLGYNNRSTFEKVETLEKDFQTPAKFHIGMLSISLISGLVFGGFITYKAREENNIFLGYIRNLIIALVCRTFFSILFDGVILLGTPFDVAGGNTLLAFEQIFLNLVLAFWLTLTIYIHARVQKNFDREPILKLYQYGVPGVAVFFAFVWIFTLQDQVSGMVWWTILNPFTQWIVNSLNLLFLLIQLALVGDIVRMMKKMSLDNDSISLLRYITIMMGVLVLIFWLQFGFAIKRVPLNNSEAYLYFYYFVDGLECALVCLVLYFFSKWVFILLKKIRSLMIGSEDTRTRTLEPSEVLLTGYDDRRIVRTDSVFMTSESKRWKILEEEGTKDVVYSNVIQPQRLKKTLELYKRFGMLPTNRVTVVEGEEFYDCQIQSSHESYGCEERKLTPNQLQNLQVSKCIATSENINCRNDIMCEQTQKKNAFYSSKYLILDSKENDFPKYLETRPSVSSVSGKDIQKEGQLKKNFPSSLDSLMSDELVRRWLLDNSDNLQKNETNKTGNGRTGEKENHKTLKDENLNLETSEHKSIPETQVKTEGESRQKENQANLPQTIVSTIGSLVSNALFHSNKSERRNSDKEKSMLSAPDEIKTAIGEQNDGKKPVETIQLKPKIAKFQEKEAVKKSDMSDDPVINTDINMGPRNKIEIVMNLKEIEKFHSEAQTKIIETSEDITGESLHSLKTEIKERSEEFKKNPTKSGKEQKLCQTNDIESMLTNDMPVQITYPESLEFRSQQHQLITEHQSQACKEQLEKLTGFSPDEYQNHSNSETENENICESLNIKNDRKESLEPQIHSATVACKTNNGETNEGIAGEPLDDLKLRYEPTLSETVMESVPVDLTRKRKSDNSVLLSLDEKISSKSTESLDQYLTYSELLDFRFQRDKETSEQPSFSFSDAIFLAFDSLINASGSFLFAKKNYPNKEKLQEAEAREIEKSDENLITNSYQAPQVKINEKPRNLQELNQENVTRKLPNFETENENVYDSPKFENKTKEPESFEPQINSAAVASKTEDEKTQVLIHAIHSSESELELPELDLKKSKDSSVTADTVRKQTSNCEKDMSTLVNEFNFSQPLKFQSQRDKPTTAHSSKNAKNIKDFDHFTELELKIPKKTSTLKSKTSDNIEKHYETYKTEEQKSFGKLNMSHDNAKIQISHAEQLEQPQHKSYKDFTPPKNRMDVNETSSDSEFSTEKRKDSSSSNSSFSLDRYYAEMINVEKKFQNLSGPIHDKLRKKL